MKMVNYSPVAILDSGIGGLSLLKILTQKYPNENYIYFADNQYMPYGNKSKKWLITRIKQLINYLYETFNVKLVILACNTASITMVDEVKGCLPVKVVGLNLNSLTLTDCKVICTKRCCMGYRHLNTYSNNKLATYIEEYIFDINNLTRKINRIVNKVNIEERNIILGCTHYELVADIFKTLYPDKNFILPCKEFVNNLKIELPNSSNAKGDIVMLSSLSTKSYIDKLWKIFKN